MSKPQHDPYTLRAPDMSDREFERFSKMVYSECGITLPPIKKAMLTARLLKRLRALEIESFAEYFDFLQGSRGNEELSEMIDCVSTNKTDFFRESAHFDFLKNRGLAELLKTPRPILRVWSAGCSTGEEPYTLAMVLEDALASRPGVNYSILATDISRRVLAIAKRAIYTDANILPVPDAFKQRYLMRGKGEQKGWHRVTPELRSHINFQYLNLMDDDFKLPHPMDVIFCRNVIIYFDRQTQIRLLQKYYRALAPGGFLFIGHSETLNTLNDKFRPIVSTIYQKPYE